MTRQLSEHSADEDSIEAYDGNRCNGAIEQFEDRAFVLPAGRVPMAAPDQDDVVDHYCKVATAADRRGLTTLADELRQLRTEQDAGVEESRTRKQKLKDTFQRVREARSEFDDFDFDLETERPTLAELKAEREELRETVEEAEEHDENADRLAGRIDELRRRKRSLDDDINKLGSVIGFNEDMVDSAGISVDIDEGTSGDGSTAALTADGRTVCLTCGS